MTPDWLDCEPEVRIGLSVMPTEDFRQAANPLFEAGLVEIVEWSFDMAWSGAPIPPWCQFLLTEYSANNALIGHGVTLSPLTVQRTDRQKEWFENLRADSASLKYIQVSEHFGFMEAGPITDAAPLPVPFLEGFLQSGIANLKHLRSVTAVPVGLENLAFAFCKRDVFAQGAFLSALLAPVDGFLVLDLHNIYCQAKNFDIDPIEILESYPVERVSEIHLSGGSWSKAFNATSSAGEATNGQRRLKVRRDTHDGEVPDRVIELLACALAICPNLQFIILERLGDTMNDLNDYDQFRQDYQRILEVVHCGQWKIDMAAARRASKAAGKSAITVTASDAVHALSRENLAAYQDELITLLASPLAPAGIVEKLSGDERFSPLSDYIKEFDLDMVDVASQLIKKWGSSY